MWCWMLVVSDGVLDVVVLDVVVDVVLDMVVLDVDDAWDRQRPPGAPHPVPLCSGGKTPTISPSSCSSILQLASAPKTKAPPPAHPNTRPIWADPQTSSPIHTKTLRHVIQDLVRRTQPEPERKANKEMRMKA